MKSLAPSRRATVVAAVSIFLFAIALRLPSCYQSFWLDELHSAWAVEGTLAEVNGRADMGHQTPFYFLGLWGWKQLGGGSEVWLRLSSVLLTSLACAALTWGLARWTKSLAAGATAGGILAIESNSIFFGTELRPYALVMLLAAIASVSFLQLSDTRTRSEKPLTWSILVLATLLAALIQPTALGVLAFLPLSLLLRWVSIDSRASVRFRAIDAVLLFGVAATAIALWRITLGESWQQRSQWASFGSATSFSQFFDAWDWLWLLATPLCLTAMVGLLSVSSERRDAVLRHVFNVAVLSSIAVLATGSYWIVSRMEWAPIWHRRYFIAALPIFACLGGIAVAAARELVAQKPYGRLIALTVGVGFLLGLGGHQRTLWKLRNYPVALAVRGEDWRDAIAWINERAADSDFVLLDSGLIEASSSKALPTKPSTAPRIKSDARVRDGDPFESYLRFPVRGPYLIDHHVDLCNMDKMDLIPKSSRSTVANDRPQPRRWILARRPAHQLREFESAGATVTAFGGVTVLSAPDDLEWKSAD